MKILKNKYLDQVIKNPYPFLVALFPIFLSFNIVLHLYDDFAYIGNFYSNYYQIYIHIIDLWVLFVLIWGLILNLKNNRTRGWQYVLLFGFFLSFQLILNFDFYSLYFSLRLFLYFSCGWVLFKRSKLFKSYYSLFLNLFALVGLLQSILACYQFFKGEMLGLTFLGESVIQLGGYSASCVNLGDSMFLRAYGTFPHPNILGGFLVFALLSSVLLIIKAKEVYLRIVYSFISGILFLALILTWSRSCWLVLLVLSLYWVISDLNAVKSFVKKTWYFVPVLVTLLAILGLVPFFLFRIDISQILISDSFTERLELIARSWDLIKTNPIFGIGPGNFVRKLANNPLYTSGKMALLQPVHNIPVLLLVEFGSLFFLSLCYLLFNIIKTLKSSKIFWSVCFILLIISMFDHYLYTLPQGLGLILAGIFLVKVNYAKIPKKSVDGTCHSGGSERTF